MNYEFHEIANIFPLMTDEEMCELTQDIKANGLKQPIILYEGKIYDGRNRYQACVSASVDPKFTEYKGNTPYSDVMSLNMQRRHLTAGQKAMIASDILPDLQKESKISKIRKNVFIEAESKSWKDRPVEIVSKLLNVGSPSIQFAKKLKKELPDIAEKVKNGKLNLKQAKNALYKKKEAEKKSTVDVEIKEKDIRLHNCDIADSLIDNNSLDVIITDPPYPKGFLSCWTKLARFASEKLKDGGVLLALSGQSYLPEVYANMKIEGLNYYWTGAIYQPDVPTVLQTKRIMTNWKPLLIYTKGEYKGTYQGTDTYISDYKDTEKGKEYHDWGQNEKIFSKIVTDWTYTNDLVCDPFMGSGTTALACIKNKRRFVGIEINEQTYKVAKARIAEVLL